MRKILFVDDEPKVLEGLQRMLRTMRREWEMGFAPSGAEALEILAANPFDVVVTDMRMPGMDGAQLLIEVRKRYPQIVRIILSGHSDQEMILKSVGPAHQYLSKPCDAEALKVTVARACALRDLLTNESLQRLVSQMQSLPSLPHLYLKLVEELQSPEASIKRVGEIISQDIGMTAKILQMVNSAFFGVRRHVSSPVEATSLLGLDTIMALVLSIQVFSQFKSDQTVGPVLDTLWTHSMAVGTFAKWIARAEGQENRLVEDTFTAGLLHESGKLVLATNLPKEYLEMVKLAHGENLSLIEAERRVFGAAHPEVGAYLLGLWGLPDSIVEAVAFHHCPSQCLGQSFSPLTAVHAAVALEREIFPDEVGMCVPLLDADYLAKLGLLDRIKTWKVKCGQMGYSASN
jgi:HD-like signal output (HDOD) protein